MKISKYKHNNNNNNNKNTIKLHEIETNLQFVA